MRRGWLILPALFVMAALLVVSACSGSDETAREAYALAPESALPGFVSSAPPQVKEAYRFAIANPDVLKAFPCYCGCGSMGHENNLDCYIKEIQSDGSIVFENHAFG